MIVILQDQNLYAKIKNIKNKYLIGLHFNWHNYNFKPDNLYDFHLAGKSDLIDKNGTLYNTLDMDACNFTPSCYQEANVEKFWDVLIVGNPVFFKRPEVVLNTIRELYNTTSKKLKVLYICPEHEYNRTNIKSIFYDIRDYYNYLKDIKS